MQNYIINKAVNGLTPKLSSDFIYPKKGSNWRTVVINTNSITITHKKEEILAMADYCDPALMSQFSPSCFLRS